MGEADPIGVNKGPPRSPLFLWYRSVAWLFKAMLSESREMDDDLLPAHFCPTFAQVG